MQRLDINSDTDEEDEEVSARLRRRSTINLGNQRQRNMRRLRLKVYNFLEKPLNASSAPYHFCIFALVLTTIVLGAAHSDDNHLTSGVHFGLEIFLVTFFLIEFTVRMWSVSADAKYQHRWGRLNYLLQSVTLIDLVIISATAVLLLLSGNYTTDKSTLDYLRFIQILRLFHVDRQMTTWKLLKRMITISKWQLAAAYYITLVIGIALATIIYSTEAIAQDISENGYRLDVPNGTDPTFPTLAHSWWFTAVTVLTIGYGDIVPSGAITKLVVCVLGFIAFCTFQAANTQISVGLTLMMEEENKKECTVRLRSIAASTIQTWYRYHLATDWKSSRKYTYFTHVCYKLYVTEERINQNRALAQRIKDKLERKNNKKKKSITHQNSVSAEILKMSLKRVVKPIVDHEKHEKSDRAPILRRTHSEERRPSMPEPISLVDAAIKKRLTFAEGRQATNETSMSSSCDISDIENHIEMTNLLEENLDDLSPKEVDIKLLMKYRPLLRFFNYILFRSSMRKFRIQRKAGELLTIEAEITERENSRNTKMKELEATIASVVGKPAPSPFDDTNQKIGAIERVEFCEKKMGEIEEKIDRINELTMQMLNLLDITSNSPTPSDNRGLPPPPPSRKQRGMRRQVTISDRYQTSVIGGNDSPPNYEDDS